MKAIFFATAALIAVVSTPASAAVVTLNIFGTLSNATLMHTTSGPEGIDPVYTTTNISGQAYKATASFDLIFNPAGIASYQLVGFKSDIGGNDYYNEQRTQATSTSLNFNAFYNTLPGGAIYYGNTSTEFQIFGNPLTQNGNLATLNLDNVDYENSTGSFYYDRGISSTLNPAGGDDYYQSAGTLKITQISFPVVAAVPEPASWALMIGGFGLVGGTLRRRSMKATSTTTVFA